jgi:hypothetical protein
MNFLAVYAAGCFRKITTPNQMIGAQAESMTSAQKIIRIHAPSICERIGKGGVAPVLRGTVCNGA